MVCSPFNPDVTKLSAAPGAGVSDVKREFYDGEIVATAVRTRRCFNARKSLPGFVAEFAAV